jgi:hypothetical protein
VYHRDINLAKTHEHDQPIRALKVSENPAMCSSRDGSRGSPRLVVALFEDGAFVGKPDVAHEALCEGEMQYRPASFCISAGATFSVPLPLPVVDD